MARASASCSPSRRARDGLTTTEISQHLRISRPTTYHLIHTFVGTGMITRADNHRYIVGLRVATLTEAFRRQFVPTEYPDPLHSRDRPADRRERLRRRMVERRDRHPRPGPGIERGPAAENQLGPYSAANARASGKLMLAYATRAQRKDYLDRHPPHALHPVHHYRCRRLEKEFAAIVKRGYATDEQEFAEGLSCLAVPWTRARHRSGWWFRRRPRASSRSATSISRSPGLSRPRCPAAASRRHSRRARATPRECRPDRHAAGSAPIPD